MTCQFCGSTDDLIFTLEPTALPLIICRYHADALFDKILTVKVMGPLFDDRPKQQPYTNPGCTPVPLTGPSDFPPGTVITLCDAEKGNTVTIEEHRYEECIGGGFVEVATRKGEGSKVVTGKQ